MADFNGVEENAISPTILDPTYIDTILDNRIIHKK
jgi:hypothetical protein